MPAGFGLWDIGKGGASNEQRKAAARNQIQPGAAASN
jgi:hypothetical protein